MCCNIPLPETFVEYLAAFLICASLLIVAVSFFPGVQAHAKRFAAILLVVALTLFSRNGWTYFASVFIVATAVTELEFLQILAAIIKGDKNYFDYKKAVEGAIVAPVEEKRKRLPLENKILNTLWTKQVNKWPDFSQMFTFKLVPESPEFAEFRKAANILLGAEFVRETGDGQLFLTRTGLDYCKQHHAEFPPDQWWPEEQINPQNLKMVLQK